MAALVSVVIHGVAVWALLPHGRGRAAGEVPATFEVELVDQAAEVKGTPAAPPPAQPPPAADTPPLPPPDQAGVLPPSSPPVQPPRQDVPPGPSAPASVNLGRAAEDQQGLLVTGDNVVPPRPDATVRNKPPAYPAEAVQRHAEGTVGLRVHVTESGTPGWVDLVHSAGDASLDQAAREAVALWRFQPARDHGVPVPFDYVLEIRFTMGGR